MSKPSFSNLPEINDLIEVLQEKARVYECKYEINDFTYFDFGNMDINIRTLKNSADLEMKLNYNDKQLTWYAHSRSRTFNKDINDLTIIIDKYFAGLIFVSIKQKKRLIFPTKKICFVYKKQKADNRLYELNNNREFTGSDHELFPFRPNRKS